MERFCTMPVKRSSILNGHVLEAFIRNMITALLILLVAFLIGFRPEADFIGWCAALLIISLYILTLSWISVYFGMIANSPEGAGSFLSLIHILFQAFLMHSRPDAVRLRIPSNARYMLSGYTRY